MDKFQLHESIDVLPPPLQAEVADFVAFLRYKYRLPSSESKSKASLSEFIGLAPDLDVASFDQYLTETRSEWKEPF
ncbi:DUF2281 domain-containing protein [Persicitalea jodogahamensis]|nr:DUF2281 domain-containing protein [Persicitalea jodogahamensis]